LSPAFLEAVKNIAPKRRASRVPFVIGLGMAAVVAFLATDAPTREFISTRWHSVAGATDRH
jgi:hypothetical protein